MSGGNENNQVESGVTDLLISNGGGARVVQDRAALGEVPAPGTHGTHRSLPHL